MILALKTDQPEAEIYLLNDSGEHVDSIIWSAHRALSITILDKIELILTKNNKSLSDITGIIVFEGPGSFTGLRIGITVANTMAYSLLVPIASASGSDWIKSSTDSLLKCYSPKVISPLYGSEPNITKPKK